MMRETKTPRGPARGADGASASTAPHKATTNRPPFTRFQLSVIDFLAGDWRSAWDAARTLNTCCLRSAIAELKRRGVQIETKRSCFIREDGRKVNHCLYRLAPGEWHRVVERQRHALAGRQ